MERITRTHYVDGLAVRLPVTRRLVLHRVAPLTPEQPVQPLFTTPAIVAVIVAGTVLVLQQLQLPSGQQQAGSTASAPPTTSKAFP